MSEKTREQELFDEYNTPEEFRSALSYMAYERGHSAGEDEVFSYLRELVDDLSKPIKNFEKRLASTK